MADVAVLYSLVTPGPDITFNNGDFPGSDDIYYITEIRGLDGAPIRTPIDNAPQAHGGIVHNFWKGPRVVVITGILLVQSVSTGVGCQTIRNDMEADLRDALDSILQADGTLSWTALGQPAASLLVRNNIPLETDGILPRTFTFGLVAEDPDF